MRVLLVEDETALADVVRKGLTAEGFSVTVVHDGITGLAVASEQEFDVIVLDIMLPGMHGYAVLRELRKREIWAPILMLTAKDGEYDEADAFDLGADDYLTKPFSFVVLVARLRSLIRRGRPERPAVLEAGDLTLDPARKRVARGETEVSLTAKELSLLEFLMHHRGTVVSKAQILDGVWDPSFHGDENIVEVYVGYLRKKVDVPFGTKSIETVRGIGYRLVES